MFQRDDQNQVTVDYGGKDRIFTPSALLAMLLGDVKKNVLATMERLSNGSSDNNNNNNDKSIDDLSIEYLLSIPFGVSQEAKEDLLDAAYAAGMGEANVVDSCHCY